jgi:hypothetical protein
MKKWRILITDGFIVRLLIVLFIDALATFYWTFQPLTPVDKVLKDGYNVTHQDYWCWVGVEAKSLSTWYMIYYTYRLCAKDTFIRKLTSSFLFGILTFCAFSFAKQFFMMYEVNWLDPLFIFVSTIIFLAKYITLKNGKV